MEQSFKCSCLNHEVHIELSEDKQDNYVYLTIWQQGFGCKPSFWGRLRMMWHILWHGIPERDMVVLDPQETMAMGEIMLNLGQVADFREKQKST